MFLTFTAIPQCQRFKFVFVFSILSTHSTNTCIKRIQPLIHDSQYNKEKICLIPVEIEIGSCICLLILKSSKSSQVQQTKRGPSKGS